jgi:hypothetical protein
MTFRGLPQSITESPFSDLYVRSKSRLELKRKIVKRGVRLKIQLEKKRICVIRPDPRKTLYPRVLSPSSFDNHMLNNSNTRTTVMGG